MENYNGTLQEYSTTKMTETPTLAIIIPCYNEEEVLELTINRLIEVIEGLIAKNKIKNDSFLYLVNDGSTDRTWDIIMDIHKTHSCVKGIKFTRNFGNQNALIAGLTNVSDLGADCSITIDADLQQDENKIEEFIDKYMGGADIVCGIRNDRKTDPFIKKWTAILFYKFMNLLGVKIQMDHSDYRLTSAKAMRILKQYKEVNMFLRGLFYELGLKTDYVKFDVKKRMYGKSKFTLFSLYALALEGITSFSIVPLRIVYFSGFFLALFSFIMCCYVVWERIYDSHIVAGWATIVFVLCLIGGIQILAIGIIGEYVGQPFREVKGRPRFVVDEKLY